MWHTTPQARAILARCEIGSHTQRHSLIGPDNQTVYHTDERTEARLNALRSGYAAKAVGYTWAEAMNPYDREACLQFSTAMGPDISEVLDAERTRRDQVAEKAA